MSYYDDDEPHDYGFDLPDKRWSGVTTDDQRIELFIHRRWFCTEDRDVDYACSFVIVVDGIEVLHFPEYVDEGKAMECLYIMFDIDQESTNDIMSSYREMEQERRMGA